MVRYSMNYLKITLVTMAFLISFLLLPEFISAQAPIPCLTGVPGDTETSAKCIMVSEQELGFKIPNFTDILTFALRAVFVFGGLAALFMLLLGAFSWITSGGDKEKVGAAQQKIQAAIIGVIMIAVALAIVVTLEQVIFSGRICLGLSCPITIPSLLQGPDAQSPSQILPASEAVVVTVTPDPSLTGASATNSPTIGNPDDTNRLYNLPSTGSR